jgi:hypothetical protein
VIGRLALSTGTMDTTTTLTNFAGSTNGAAAIRGAYTMDGTNMYAALSVGVRYATYGTANASTGVAIDGTNNARRNTIFNGQLYQTEAANSRSGVESVGSGTPTTAGSATMSLLPGFSTTNGTYSPYDIWFANANTLYIADDSASASTAPGLQKWTFNGSTWSLVFNHSIAAITPGGSAAAKGIKSLTGFLDANGDAILFASTVGANANLLLSLVDPVGNTSAANVTETTLVDASTAFGGTAWNLRGVALAPGASVPEPSTLALVMLCSLGFVTRRSLRNS